MSGATDRETTAILVDVSRAQNSAQAVQILEEFINESGLIGPGSRIDLNAGNVLLTQNVLEKIRHALERLGVRLETVFSSVPQTQQAALDGGFYVKEKPLAPRPTEMKDFLAPEQVESVDNFMTRPAERKVTGLFSMSGKASDILLPFERQMAPMEGVAPPVSPESAPMPMPSSMAPPEFQEAAGTPLAQPQRVPSQEASQESALPTRYIKQTLRSGQVVRDGGNLVIIGDVHAGAEVSAGGDITIWGELRGVAHAGTRGDYQAEIRALKIEALQLRIAEFIARRPDRIYYHKEAEAVAKASPELAKVADGEIKIFKEIIGR